ncbi:MAG: DUF1461 domain-containing protein [Candidatus Curtissbacteria bacterium]|nr:DUF1461 domain-containing protein [Candidatus Curtissbacteria bacterium]
MIIILSIIIILGNFNFLIFNKNHYRSLYIKVGVYQNFQNQKIIDSATDNLFGYFRGQNKLDQNFFSMQAVSHLKDVKDLLQVSNGLFYFSFIAVICLGIFLVAKKRSKIVFKSLFISSIVTIIFVVMLGLGAATAFDSFFLKFHQLLFTNTLWLFPPDDNLIRLFPQQFFVEFANRLALNILITSIIIASVAFSISHSVIPNLFRDLQLKMLKRVQHDKKGMT